jgi:hypothetical protein
MSKIRKIILISVSIALSLLLIFFLLISAFWSGALNFLFPEEIATYNSPNGEYFLVFEQLGSPAWPFGPADVRLTLKNRSGKTLGRISAEVSNDGGNASEYNIASVSWGNEEVIFVLRSQEAPSKQFSIAYDD